VEIEIFHDSHEKRLPNYPNISEDEPYMGTSFGQGGGGFNQFGSMEGAISGSDFLINPGPSTLDVTEPVSSSRGYQSQERGSAGAPRSSHVGKRTRLQRFMQGGRSALRVPGGHLHPVNVPSSAVVAGGNIGPTNELSPDAWSGHSSPHEIGDVNASGTPQREPHEEDRPQLERSDMSMDDAHGVGELQSDAEAPARPSSDVASAVAALRPSSGTAGGLGAVNDTDARVHDAEEKEDDTSEGSKKRKEPVFLGGVELVDLDDCDVPDRRLQCDSKDTNNEDVPNREGMDANVGAPSCRQTVGPSSSTASAQVSAAVPLQTDPPVELGHPLGFRIPYSMQQGRPPIRMLSL
jgi:hypothetical protein